MLRQIPSVLPVGLRTGLCALLLWSGGCANLGDPAAPSRSRGGFAATVNQVWVGEQFWANRMQDWSIRNGRLVCENGRLPMRTVHQLRTEITGVGNFETRTDIDLEAGVASRSSGAGFLIGVGEAMDWRARAIVHQWSGPGAGLFAGISGDGELFLRDNEQRNPPPIAPFGALDRSAWSATASSEEPDQGTSLVTDGDPETFWHSRWRERSAPYPHHLTIDLGAETRFAGLAMRPRLRDRAARPAGFRLDASLDGARWQTLTDGTLPDRSGLFQTAVPETTARFVRLTLTEGHRPQPGAALAELWLLDVPPEPAERAWPGQVELVLTGQIDGGGATLRLRALDARSGKVLGSLQRQVPAARVRGGVAVVSHPGLDEDGAQFAFGAWSLGGKATRSHADRGFGPVACTQYTLHEGTLKLTAQLLPLRIEADLPTRLEVLRGGEWVPAATAIPSSPDYTAAFRVEGWDDRVDHRVRVVVPWRDRDGDEYESTYDAVVRRDPRNKPRIVVAGMTGNHNNSHAIGGGWGLGEGDGRTPPNDWVQGMWFPHAELVEHVGSHEPDLLFFSGDQIYEGKSPTGVDREQLGLDYLYKWSLWCWAWRDLTRTIPSVCIPDDHDVYQGNLWGQGGRASPGRDNEGGYVHPAWFVRMVEATQTSHLPDPVDPTPVEQGIGVYFTNLVWGRVGFAILEDRKFKDGCAGVLPPEITPGRPDHVTDPRWEPQRADVPGKSLLGRRQLDWLEDFAVDWRQQDLKMVLSQTIFASLSTHHGPGLVRYEADLDSNGWPQSGRKRALRVLRKCFPLHLAGDQHLASIVQHGIDQHGDALWSFCVPSVANFYPRAWAPSVRGPFEPVPMDQCLGDSRDGFGNLVSVHAVTNPGVKTGRTPTDLYDRMPGYGIVVINKADRTYEMQCWPRHVDPTAPGASQYPGWPRKIRQWDNFSPRPLGYLPRVEVEGLLDPVVTVYRQGEPRALYSLRVRGREFRPPIYAPGTYRVTVGCPDLGLERTLDGLTMANGTSEPPRRVSF